jgi:hypothetical protein
VLGESDSQSGQFLATPITPKPAGLIRILLTLENHANYTGPEDRRCIYKNGKGLSESEAGQGRRPGVGY